MNFIKMVSAKVSQYRATLKNSLPLKAVTLYFSLILLSPAFAGELNLGDFSLDSKDALIYGGVLLTEFAIGKSSLKSNSTVELVLNILKAITQKTITKKWRF